MNGIIDSDRPLIAHVTLKTRKKNTCRTRERTDQEHINCHLFRFVLKVVDIRTRNTLCGVGKDS